MPQLHQKLLISQGEGDHHPFWPRQDDDLATTGRRAFSCASFRATVVFRKDPIGANNAPPAISMLSVIRAARATARANARTGSRAAGSPVGDTIRPRQLDGLYHTINGCTA